MIITYDFGYTGYDDLYEYEVSSDEILNWLKNLPLNLKIQYSKEIFTEHLSETEQQEYNRLYNTHFPEDFDNRIINSNMVDCMTAIITDFLFNTDTDEEFLSVVGNELQQSYADAAYKAYIKDVNSAQDEEELHQELIKHL